MYIIIHVLLLLPRGVRVRIGAFRRSHYGGMEVSVDGVVGEEYRFDIY
jgi:hypothetical protein